MMKMVSINLVDWVPGCGYEYGIHRVMIAKKSSMPLMSALPGSPINNTQPIANASEKGRQPVRHTALFSPSDCYHQKTHSVLNSFKT